MKWMRNSAAVIGLLFGCFVIFMNVADAGPRQHPVTLAEVVIMFAGPVSLIVASLVGLKFARVAGWWLIAGALLVAGWIVAKTPGIPSAWGAAAILTVPMFLCAALWFGYARDRRVQA